MNDENLESFSTWDFFDAFTAAALWVEKNPFYCHKWDDRLFQQIAFSAIGLTKKFLVLEGRSDEQAKFAKNLSGKLIKDKLLFLKTMETIIIPREYLLQIAKSAKHKPKFLFLENDAMTEKSSRCTNNTEENVEITTHKLSVKRRAEFNEIITQVIREFYEINNYYPASTQEVLNRMKNKPPLGEIINFSQGKVSINGGEAKPIANLERAIKRIIETFHKN